MVMMVRREREQIGHEIVRLDFMVVKKMEGR